MITPEQFREIRERLIRTESPSSTDLQSDVEVLLKEVERLTGVLQQFTSDTSSRLTELASDMVRLEEESDRLRKNKVSAEFERDACVGLLCRMAERLGFRAGRTDTRAVIDLPTGQVSWDFLPDEAHLFAELPVYENEIEAQSIQETYSKVMSPGI